MGNFCRHIFNKKLLIGVMLFFCGFSIMQPYHAQAEGSGVWGTASGNRSWLWVPEHATSSVGNGHYITRGYMMMPSTSTDYNPDHRLYVYVKNGETVHWGFRKVKTFVFSSSPGYTYYDNSDEIRVRWYYDNTDETFYPDGTSGVERTLRDDHQYNAHANGGAQGRPANATAAANGPNAIVGSGGYDSFSFSNNTGEDRAFWVEISDSSGNPLTDGLPINFWDITVYDDVEGEQTGRVYSKFWSILSDVPETAGEANTKALHNNFGFYVPVDDTYGGGGDSYFVKRAKFSNSNAGFVNFFANADGPRNDQGNHVDNRKSIQGTSSNYQYPLFMNDPDLEFWQTTDPPEASLEITYQEQEGVGQGGEAWVDFSISLPGIVDVLIDLNGNGVYDTGVDIVMSESYDSPGDYQIYWDGKDANDNIVKSGSPIEVFAAVIFSPVHFPVYDMEQSLGITITNVRPGDAEDNDIYWDDSLIPRDGESGFEDLDDSNDISAVSEVLNVTGEAGTSHIWYADGDNGFSQNNTINTWAASYYAEINEDDEYKYLIFQGNVFDDLNGLDDNTVNGDPTSAPGLYALLIDDNDKVVQSVAVASDGTYVFEKVADGTFEVVLSAEDASAGENNPGSSLPGDWENTGENIGSGEGDDGSPNGRISTITLNNTSLNNANFGLWSLSTLPVVWSNWEVIFNAEERKAALNWETHKEWETSHFDIERSIDGIDEFEKIGEVSAQGWSDQKMAYHYNDEDLPLAADKAYYRLKQVDLDGTFSFSEILAVDIPGLAIRSGVWRAYPNPANGQPVKVDLLKKGAYQGESISLKIFNSFETSEVIQLENLDHLSRWVDQTLRSFPPGLFVLEIQWGNQVEYIKLIAG